MENYNDLITFLKQDTRKIRAIVMPDFFLDRIINLEFDPSQFFSIVKTIAKRKSGSKDGVSQTDLRGGNAINTASALASLGIQVKPIICTSKLGMQQLTFHLKPLGVDLSHVKILDKASITTALEFNSENGKINIMLRDLGSLANFSSANLTDDDYELIESADYVCVFNWAGTRNHGTEFSQNIFQRVKKKGKGKTYFDTADPTPNRENISELMENVLKTRLVDILSLNENEAATYASLLSKGFDLKEDKTPLEELAIESSRLLADQLSARIDLHTTSFSGTFTKNAEKLVPSFKVKALRATGAGDAWNAGNILADGNELPDERRLALANAVSACYLSDPAGAHPTKRKLVSFLKNSRFGNVT